MQTDFSVAQAVTYLFYIRFRKNVTNHRYPAKKIRKISEMFFNTSEPLENPSVV